MEYYKWVHLMATRNTQYSIFYTVLLLKPLEVDLKHQPLSIRNFYNAKVAVTATSANPLTLCQLIGSKNWTHISWVPVPLCRIFALTFSPSEPSPFSLYVLFNTKIRSRNTLTTWSRHSSLNMPLSFFPKRHQHHFKDFIISTDT